MKKISPAELKAKLDADETIHLIDLRDCEHYRHNHIPYASCVPFNKDFEQVMENTFPDRNIPVIGYFDGEPAYEEACAKLEAMGYQEILCLDGGLRGWMEQGYQLEFGTES